MVISGRDLDVPLGPVAHTGRRVHRPHLAQRKHNLQVNFAHRKKIRSQILVSYSRILAWN
jgi:hypothetical protein